MKENLKELLGVQTTSYDTQQMTDYICSFLDENNIPFTCGPDELIYVTKGEADIYPCMVAHTDTVHDIEPTGVTIYEQEGMFFAMNGNLEQVGTGGDDKVGIFVTLQLLLERPYMKALFVPDEEVGCKGSALANKAFFDDVGFVLQCDRKGNKDFTSSIMGLDMIEESFTGAISDTLDKWERVLVDGGMTDVWQLARLGIDVCMANMSCGYYRPHRADEVVSWGDVEDTYNFCKDLFDDLQGQRWPIDRSYKARATSSWSFNWEEFEGSVCTCGSGGTIWVDPQTNEEWCLNCDYTNHKS